MTKRLHIPRILVLLTAFALLMSACGGSGGGPPRSGSAPPPSNEWLIPQGEVADGGPGPDGIPSIDDPKFDPITADEPSDPAQLIIGMMVDGVAKAYPHEIMDWHEIINDGTDAAPYTMSYCPLTGTALAWKGDPAAANPDFGVSGLLFNSNLILYDRETSSLWPQMFEQSVNGPRIREVPTRMQVIETSWGTWRAMYPDSLILSPLTGHRRDYGDYPYGDYKDNSGLLFPVANADQRLHPKTRVLGIRENGQAKVYQIAGFGTATMAINEQFGSTQIVVVGNSAANFGAIYDRTLSDGTILNFTAIDGQLPNVLQDDEGNVWDIFGEAVSGPRIGASY